MRITTKTQRHEIKQRTDDRGQILIRHSSSVIRRQGFTLIEIVVAIGLMVIVVLFAGSIFKAGIGSYRTAMAQTEIMQKLRVITQQLDSDFRGLRKDAPMFIWFQKGTTGPDDANRFDQVMFFADGDFQATRVPVVGNVARIYYGQARIYSPIAGRFVDPTEQVFENAFDRVFNIDHRTLSRRQHISTADTTLLAWPDLALTNFDTVRNDSYEYDWISLSQWQAIANDPTIPLKVQQIINVCFSRPSIDLANANAIHLLMAQGVGSFSVQWSYPYTDAAGTHIYWWPSIDPDGNGNFSDSDFGPADVLNVYSNAAKPGLIWVKPDEVTGTYYPAVKPTYPQALKFTFAIYDSRGVFRDGQTFTHIVYLSE
jgi:prepilin-type N-terminal cleavage/methylation domain-containing protein